MFGIGRQGDSSAPRSGRRPQRDRCGSVVTKDVRPESCRGKSGQEISQFEESFVKNAPLDAVRFIPPVTQSSPTRTHARNRKLLLRNRLSCLHRLRILFTFRRAQQSGPERSPFLGYETQGRFRSGKMVKLREDPSAPGAPPLLQEDAGDRDLPFVEWHLCRARPAFCFRPYVVDQHPYSCTKSRGHGSHLKTPPAARCLR